MGVAYFAYELTARGFGISSPRSAISILGVFVGVVYDPGGF